MKSIFSVFILCFCLLSCGNCIPPDWAKPYTDMFNHEAELRGCSLRAETVEYVMHEDFEEDNHIGYCDYTLNEIAVRESFWFKASETQREILMIHEMGHCILGWGHWSSGIMQPSLMNAKEYKRNREKLLDDLFSVCGSAIRNISGRVH